MAGQFKKRCAARSANTGKQCRRSSLLTCGLCCAWHHRIVCVEKKGTTMPTLRVARHAGPNKETPT